MKSEQIDKLATALAKAQAEIKGAVKDSANPFFKSNYADLQSVWDAIREPLTKNGLAVIQTTEAATPDHLELVTTLVHSSGQWVEGRFPILALKRDPQAIGSATSYARRYALAAIVGVYQTDDDAEQAQARNHQPQPAQKPISKPVVIEPQAQQVIAQTIDNALNAATGSLGAPFDLILQKGPHAGKQIQELSLEQAKSYFESIEGELKAINRSPTTLRGPSRDVFYALQQFIELKKAKA